MTLIMMNINTHYESIRIALANDRAYLFISFSSPLKSRMNDDGDGN